MKIAWIFPGQGSQAVGMGQDLAEVGAEHLHQAQEILGWSLLDLTETELAQTTYTQPALFLVSAILTDLLLGRGHGPDCVAGHSLGEYSALYAAGVLDFPTTLHLVQQRATLMAQGSPGGMTAVIGFDRQRLEELCAATVGVTIANDNSPDQVVITGDKGAIEQVVAALQPKRAVPLPVSGAFHSPFMARAAEQFNQILAGIPFAPARFPIYCNATAGPTQDPEQIKANLRQQMTAGVRWRETVLAMAAAGITDVWEIGPGNVLSNLVKRTAPQLQRLNISGLKSLPEAH
ncbi:MAG: ACP S-malonyltransferase [Thermostichales cyanobacterium SZTDM-1c_bins_54]